MRSSVIALCLMAWAIEAELADAAFVIQLKNGNEFVTGRHWQEGKQVMFDVYGGVLGVDKNFVSKIARSDKPVQLLVDTRQSQDEKSQDAARKDESKSNQALVPSTSKTEVKSDPNDPILKEFEALKQNFSSLDGMLTSELNAFAKNLAALKRKIQTSAKPNDYLNQFTELHKIGDELEDTLKKRNQ
jgi:serine kinase of HPr protein (carbohydrate metabolism regulator)